MLLTQLTVSLKGEGGRHLVRSAFRLHQMIYRNFPDDQRVLFRLEPYGEAHFARILVQHQQNPPEFWESFGAYFLEEPKHRLLDPLEAGARYLFRLAGAPTKAAPAPTARRGREFDLRDIEDQVKWLRRRLEGVADVEQVDVLHSRLRVVSKPGGEYRFREALFQGVLVCRDVDGLTALRSQGIGKRKSAGAGLLSLVRASW
jgi:CRISPR-associated protein Cas6/Cse3/CasE subtype I-E